MDRNKIKESVLDELISMMESKEVEGLKSKSPKFMKLEVEAIKPEMEDEMESEDLQEGLEADKDVVGKVPELPKVMGKEPEDDELDLERLKELYSKLK